jgi:L-fucose isomerase-like protein
MSPKPRIGFITCVHPIYNLPAVVRHRDDAVEALTAAGCEVVPAETPKTTQEAGSIAAALREQSSDLLLFFFCTWVAEDITLALANEMREIPMAMWALPYFDRDIPMPSPMSGLTATASNVRRSGKDFVHFVGPVRAGVVERVVETARAAAVVRKLRHARFGLIGQPCPGMLDVIADEAELQRLLGPETIRLELNALLDAAHSASKPEAGEMAATLANQVGAMVGVSHEDLADNLRMYLGARKLVESHRLDGYCVRCWPELRDQNKSTICLTHALMAGEGIANSCEIDLPALITTYVMKELSGGAAYNFDLTAFLEEEDAVQLAHCGSACLEFAGDPKRASLRRHMRTQTGVTLELPFKPGLATLAKLLRPTDGRLTMFISKGEVIASDGVRGSVATVKPEPSAKAFLDTMVEAAVEHHLVLGYGDQTGVLAQFCRLAGINVLTAE